METAEPLLQSQIPAELPAYLIWYLERRIPPGKYLLGELKKRLLICAVSIVNHYGWKADRKFKDTVQHLVSILAEAYSHLTRDGVVLPGCCSNPNSIESLLAKVKQAPP